MWILVDFFSILTLFAFFVPEKAEIIVSPMNTEAAVGEDATLSCVTSAGRCAWYHLPIGASGHELLYQEGFTYNGYKERFRVMETNHGMCNLLIENVQIEDAGLFTCLEASGSQAKETAELIVFEQYPSNQYCSAKITCSPSCNILELSCNMMSRGNIKPFMEWRDAGGNLVKSSIDKAASVVQVIEDLSKYLVYTCYVKYLNESLSSKFSWSYSASVTLEYKPTATTKESVQKEYTYIVAIAITCGFVVLFLITTFISAAINVILFVRNASGRDPNSIVQVTNSPGAHYTCDVDHRPLQMAANYDTTPFIGEKPDISVDIPD